MSFYERLVGEVEAERETFLALPFIQAGMRGELTKESYIGYLSEAFHHVKHTVPLIETVRSHIPRNRHAILDVLSDYSLEKIGHEKWILQDIKNAGYDADSVCSSAPAAATEELLAYAYDYVVRENPLGFFGMVYVIERTGTGLAALAAEKLMVSLDLPKKCFSYLLSHGSSDTDDVDMFKMLMTQITDLTEQEAMIHVAKRMYSLYGAIFESIAQKTGFEVQV